jgi:hypothetical protein
MVLFHGPDWLKFLLMGGVAAGGLALCSFHLPSSFSCKVQLATYGAMAVFDGGILQFVQLTACGYLSLVFYLLVEVCLHGLIHQIRRGPE